MNDTCIVIASLLHTHAGDIWFPPSMEPYWINRGPNAGPTLTDDEIKTYVVKRKESK